MARETFTLYDIPTDEPVQCWSPNIWRSRIVLNYKNVPYKTKWVEMPDIKPLLSSWGFKPHEQNTFGWPSPEYTLPVLETSDGMKIYETVPIAEYLEEHYPSPPIHIHSSYVPRIMEIFQQMSGLLMGAMAQVTRFPGNPEKFPGVLSPKSMDFFDETRTEWWGCHPEQYAKKQMTEENWKAADQAMVNMSGLLKETKGVFFEGDKLSYGDVVIHAFLIWIKHGSEETFQRLIDAGEKELKEHWEACKPWSERNDH